MKHGISDQEWIDYLDDNAESDVRDRIEAHIISCVVCWKFYEQMTQVTGELKDAGAEARRQVTLDDQRFHAMLRNIFTRIRARNPNPITDQQMKGRLNELESILAPYCGAGVAARALHTAAKHSPARSIDRVKPDNWEPFMDHLTAIAAAMCGDTFASLIREHGQL